MRCARGVGVDTAAFNAAMETQQRKRARRGRVPVRRQPRPSGSSSRDGGATEFLGYETETAEGVISAIVGEGGKMRRPPKGDEVSIVLNQTPFYGESGGQIGDNGVIRTAEGARWW